MRNSPPERQRERSLGWGRDYRILDNSRAISSPTSRSTATRVNILFDQQVRPLRRRSPQQRSEIGGKETMILSAGEMVLRP
jgi:hypothetical protein